MRPNLNGNDRPPEICGARLAGLMEPTAFVDDVTGDGADNLAIGAPATTVGVDPIAGLVLLLNGTK